MIRYLGRDAVLRLNETHGYFQFRDAQGDVSRDFANDAVSAFISAAIESTRVLNETGKTPAELAASFADAQAEIARLRGALEDEIEKSAYWAGVAHDLRGQALRGEPVDGIIQPCQCKK